MLEFDHLAISALTLEEGIEAVEAALGVPLQGGGQHVKMGTHNRLLNLGDLYLEVIAPDPSLPRPDRPRWFDLDRFTGPPRPMIWITRCDDLPAELARSPQGIGRPMPMTRGDLSWQIVVPEDGILPFDNAYPALLRWDSGTLHPAQRLQDRGIRLHQLEIGHPEADALRDALKARLMDPRIAIVQAPEKSMRATFGTPHGLRHL